MLAVAPAQKAHAFTRSILGFADPHMIERTLPQPVNGEASSADLAWDFTECVELRFLSIGNAKDADTATIRCANETDCAGWGRSVGHISIVVALLTQLEPRCSL